MRRRFYSDTVKMRTDPHRSRRTCECRTLPGPALFTLQYPAEILWDEFSTEIPENDAPAVALRLLPLCTEILAKYDLSDDFAATAEYGLLYTELTGIVQILLEDGKV